MDTKMKDIKSEYIELSIEHMVCAHNGEYKKANKAYSKLKKIFEKIQSGAVEKEILVDLLNQGDPNVECWAAAHLLGLPYEVELAQEKLKEIAIDNNLGMLAFTAKMTLSQWQKKKKLTF